MADSGWRRVFVTLMVTASSGLLMWPFAMDMPGVPVSAGGLVHLGLAGIASISTIAAVWLSLLNWHRLGHRQMRWFSSFCLVVIALSGVAAAAGAALGWPLVGLLERLTIGGFQAWLIATAARFATGPELATAWSSD